MSDPTATEATVDFIELRRTDGTTKRITGEDADKWWRFVGQAVQFTADRGFPYKGPRLTVVPPPVEAASNVVAALEG